MKKSDDEARRGKSAAPAETAGGFPRESRLSCGPERIGAAIVPAGTGRSVYTDRRSEFIGLCARIESEEEAKEKIEAVRKEHPAARHTCFAYRLRGGIVRRYSDDGEPQGSAGKPILDVLDRKGVDCALITVTRYFGGILLGTGGLVRAYSQAAISALDDAGLARLVPFAKYSVSLDYPDWSRVSQILRREGAVISDTDFGSGVCATFSVRGTEAERVLAAIVEDTAGRIRTVPLGEEYLAEPV